MAECSTSALLESGKCFDCLTTKQIQIAKLQLLCDIVAAGGGGGGGGVTCGNYGGGEPSFTPVTGCGNSVDTSNDRIWWYYNGQWN